jgi:methylphosphotriester-DNA--protein-cysteine methyltransferase
MRLRDRALRRAIAHIEDRPGMPVTIRQLCAESGVSWRTLDYAFKERFGIGPKVYLCLQGALRDRPEGLPARPASPWHASCAPDTNR